MCGRSFACFPFAACAFSCECTLQIHGFKIINLQKNEMPCINILFIEDLPSDIALELPLFIHGGRSFCRPLVVLLCKLLKRASIMAILYVRINIQLIKGSAEYFVLTGVSN